jgi:hypothetical protein
VTEEAAVALRVVSISELRLAVLVESERTRETVAVIYRRYRISRQTYYRYRKRYLAEGLEGSRTENADPTGVPPRSVPSLRPRSVVSARTIPGGGLGDPGRARKAGTSPPAVSTIHQALR